MIKAYIRFWRAELKDFRMEQILQFCFVLIFMGVIGIFAIPLIVVLSPLMLFGSIVYYIFEVIDDYIEGVEQIRN